MAIFPRAVGVRIPAVSARAIGDDADARFVEDGVADESTVVIGTPCEDD